MLRHVAVDLASIWRACDCRRVMTSGHVTTRCLYKRVDKTSLIFVPSCPPCTHAAPWGKKIADSSSSQAALRRIGPYHCKLNSSLAHSLIVSLSPNPLSRSKIPPSNFCPAKPQSPGPLFLIYPPLLFIPFSFLPLPLHSPVSMLACVSEGA